MSFCPVCGTPGETIAPRCERVARYYGYGAADLTELAARRSSIAVPFFDVKRFFFALERLARSPLARAMLAAVESADLTVTARDCGNTVSVVPFANDATPDCTELYVKEDVSKTMVIYQQDNAIEHLGCEERAVLFAEVADRFFGLAHRVPAAVCGLSPAGTKFVASAGLSKRRFLSLEERARPDLRALWREGVLPQLTLLDFVLGQNDRNAQNVLFSAGPQPQVGLIDNDDAFARHERLAAPFAYLQGLGDSDDHDNGDLNLGTGRDWFAPFRLADLVALLSPLGLPEQTMISLGRRFAFAKAAVATAMPLRDFTRAIFIERPCVSWQLTSCPWSAYRSLVQEGPRGTRYRTFVGDNVGDTYAIVEVAGQLLDDHVTCTPVATTRSASDADDAVVSLTVGAGADGFMRVLRRRFFVAGNDRERLSSDAALRIVEVRCDPSGSHLLVKRGSLGRYGLRQVERFLSFESTELAFARADAFESELLAANYQDLRTRLESFKNPAPATFF